MMMFYRIATFILTPLVPFWLYWRALRKKEDMSRLRERYGIPAYSRPEGLLIWLHAASVGEANSLLTFISRVRERFPKVRLLITTGTVTSAALMKKRLPGDVYHQYVPVDTPEALHPPLEARHRVLGRVRAVAEPDLLGQGLLLLHGHHQWPYVREIL